MLCATSLCVAFLLMVTPLFAENTDRTLVEELQRLENEFGGHLGVAAKNLKTGEVISFNGGERFPTASVIKLPIMTAFFHLVDRNMIDPNMKVVLAADDKKPGLLKYLSDGMTMTLLDAVNLMIVLSENTATNLVLDRLALRMTGDCRLSTIFFRVGTEEHAIAQSALHGKNKAADARSNALWHRCLNT